MTMTTTMPMLMSIATQNSPLHAAHPLRDFRRQSEIIIDVVAVVDDRFPMMFGAQLAHVDEDDDDEKKQRNSDKNDEGDDPPPPRPPVAAVALVPNARV